MRLSSTSRIFSFMLLPAVALPMLAAERLQARPPIRAAANRAIIVDPTRNNIFPYLYDGAGWSTTFVFTNLDNRPIDLSLQFTADDGSNLQIPVNGIGSTSNIDIPIQTGGTASLTTSDFDSSRTSGYAFAAARNGTDRFAGYAVVRQQTSGLPDLEFTLPLTSIDENQFVLPFDNTNGFATFVSLVNSSTQNTANVNVTVQDQSGNAITTDQLQIGPLARMTFNVTDRYPQANNIVASIFFNAPGSQFVTGLGLRSGPNNSLTAITPFSLAPPR